MYAAGGLAFDYPGLVRTVLVNTRAWLAASDRPDRIFQVTLDAARQAGLVGRRRVLNSTPLYHAVATMDTGTLVRAAIRGVLRAPDPRLRVELRAVLRRDDDYAAAGKPVCDYDPAARQALVDALARDDGLPGQPGRARAGRGRGAGRRAAGHRIGQDLDGDAGGVFRIARRVTPDRVISTVDPQPSESARSRP